MTEPVYVQPAPKCRNQVDALFDAFGPAAVLAALADRCGAEGSIARGEGREWKHWQQLSDTIANLEVPC